MKLLYICPHLSTGGQPQYTLKQVQTFMDDLDIVVIEMYNYGDQYVIQRNQIKDLVHLIQLNGKQDLLWPTIQAINPDVIHFQENPEKVDMGNQFISNENLKKIYDPNRKYTIIVTTHGSDTRRHDFSYFPDKIVTVSKWQKQLFEKEMPESEIDIWEYPIENLKPSAEEKAKAHRKLLIMMWGQGTGSAATHPGKNILHVGLFTPGKDQASIFELARANPRNDYHFIGNQAPNFRTYWEPLMKDKPHNCWIWGERADVDFFYKACDEFVFPSKWELCPLAIKEALSYGLPCTIRKLHTYLDDYDNNPLVTYSNFMFAKSTV